MTAEVSYAGLVAPFTAVVEALPATAWNAPSACEEWSALQVLEHVIDTQRDFFAQRGFDLGAALDVADDPAAAWRAHEAQVRQLATDPQVMATSYEGMFGPTTIGESFLSFYAIDLVVHRWDIARAAGHSERFTEDELDFLEACIANFGDALYMDGICQPALESPADADRQTRVLAALGRQA